MFEKNLDTLLHMQQCSRSRKWHNGVKLFLKSHSNFYAYSIRKINWIRVDKGFVPIMQGPFLLWWGAWSYDGQMRAKTKERSRTLTYIHSSGVK